jgi:hypothetical protein
MPAVSVRRGDHDQLRRQHAGDHVEAGGARLPADLPGRLPVQPDGLTTADRLVAEIFDTVRRRPEEHAQTDRGAQRRNQDGRAQQREDPDDATGRIEG